jgi:hypothetical protein
MKTSTLSLRAIGQALESLGIGRFELEPDGEDFVIYGYASSNEHFVIDATQESVVTSVWGMTSGGLQSDTATRAMRSDRQSVIELRYTAGDINRLEMEGRANRVNPSDAGNPARLSQLMRTIAAYLIERRGQLLHMSGNRDAITVRYRTSAKAPVKELLSASLLYEFWASLYVRRACRAIVS